MNDLFDLFSSSANRQRPTGIGYLYAFGGLLIVIGLIVLTVFEFPHFSNTLQIKRLVLISLLVGGALGGLLGWQLSRPVFDLLDKVKIILIASVFCMIFMPTLASLSNRLFSYHPLRQEAASLVKIEAYQSDRFGNYLGKDPEPTGYFTHVILQNKLFRIRSKKNIFATAQDGDTLTIPLRKGLWGYSFIELK